MAIKFASALDVLKKEAELAGEVGGSAEKLSAVDHSNSECGAALIKNCAASFDDVVNNTAVMWMKWRNAQSSSAGD